MKHNPLLVNNNTTHLALAFIYRPLEHLSSDPFGIDVNNVLLMYQRVFYGIRNMHANNFRRKTEELNSK